MRSPAEQWGWRVAWGCIAAGIACGLVSIFVADPDSWTWTWVSFAFYGLAIGLSIALGRVADRRCAAAMLVSDRKLAETLAAFRATMAEYGYEVPDVPDQALEMAMVYVTLRRPLYADPAPETLGQATLIAAPAAALAIDIRARSGRPPKKWLKARRGLEVLL